MMSAIATTAHTQAATLIPRGGGAVAILIAGIVVAVIGATVAIETQRRPFLWAIIAFLATVILVSAVHAVI